MTSLALFFWNRFPVVQEEWFLQRMKQAVIGLWICTALSGMFFTYRLGEYVQTKQMVEQNWHQVIFSPIQTN